MSEVKVLSHNEVLSLKQEFSFYHPLYRFITFGRCIVFKRKTYILKMPRTILWYLIQGNLRKSILSRLLLMLCSICL